MKSPLSFLLVVTTILLGLCLTCPVKAQCVGGICRLDSGFGLRSSVGFYSPNVVYPRRVYRSRNFIRFTPRYSYSNTYSGYTIPEVAPYGGYFRDAYGYLIAPDGGRVVAIGGVPIGSIGTAMAPLPTVYSTDSKPAASPTEGPSSNATGACTCGCEERLTSLEARVQALEDAQPIYGTELAGWQKAMAERGKPLPGNYTTLAVR